jgi:type VI secretion system secreted protein VgrG
VTTFEIKQTDRLLNISSPLGDDALILTGFKGTERLSGLFQFRLDLVSPDLDIAPEAILGREIGWSVRRPGGERRPFHGVVGRLGGGGTFGRDYRWYYLEVMPAFWLLTHTANCRIFQHLTVPEIIQQVLCQYPDMVFDLSGVTAAHPPHEYCVQYNESDFTFLSRLMEDEGIFYYFRHEVDRHVMVMADGNAAFFDCLGAVARFGVNPDVEAYISRWQRRRQFRGGRWTQRDYNFQTPASALQCSVNTVLDVPSFKPFEYFGYTGGYMTASWGEARTRLRMEAEEAFYEVIEAESTSCDMATGGRFVLAPENVYDDQEQAHFLLSLTHQATDFSHVSGEGTGEPPDYRNSFTCMSESIPYRPERTTPRPVMGGPQPALVTGPPGEEQYYDQYGRIKVQFPWDRYGRDDENSSCFIRVAQPWAGTHWGSQFLPRIGMEVLVDFLEGDPDRPFVVASAYNAVNMPPYALPQNKTQSGIKSHSTIGGGPDNYNELRFEDMIGAEQVVFQAEKDHLGLVKNDETWLVRHDRTETVGHDETIDIGHDRTETVEHDETITIGNDRTEIVGHDETITIRHDRTETVENDETITIKNDRTETIEEGDETIAILQGDRSVTLNQGDDSLELGQGNRSVTLDEGDHSLFLGLGDRTVTLGRGDDTLTLQSGDLTVTVSQGKISLQAQQSIELVVGGSTLTIDQTGISMSGMMISINGQLMTQVSGVMTTLSGDAMVVIAGGLIEIG